jgi:excisionase family DNA binding protein
MTPTETVSDAVLLRSIREAATALGVSRATIFRLMRSGDLTPVRILGRTLFEDAELHRLITRRRGKKRETARSGP